MQKIKFDFEATKERIYAPNSNVPIGAPVDQNGNIANDGNAYGIVLCKETENEKYWVKYNLVVMVAGYCDIIDAQAIWGDEYSAEAMAAMSGIEFCYDHKIPSGSDPAIANAKETGGFGWTEQGEQTTIEWDGDTDGKEHFESQGAVLYKVANVPQDFDKDSVSKITETTGETDFAVLDMSEMAGVIAFSYNNSKMLLMVVVDYEKANAIFGDASLTTNGVFFAVNGDVYTTSLTYGTPDTVHKIDEKYINGGGGAMVVHFVVDADDNLTADKTPAETVEMLNNGAVGFVFTSGNSSKLYGNIGTMTDADDEYFLCACCFVVGESINEANVRALVVSFDGETWELG